ncbi:hypothetical protein F5Y15DRAFT_371237 [Xylariaceae sp. FL0016]|nr:hypothetical protein F5Y15DRAFT_371237 [Xylariaceae sp. FL0016]
MDSSLHEAWHTASGSPFLPTVGKGSQFFVGFVLLLLGLALTGAFALSKNLWYYANFRDRLTHITQTDLLLTSPSLVFLPPWPSRASFPESTNAALQLRHL